MVEFIVNLIGNEYWATAVMSLIPLIELKGGIVFARGAGLDFLTALVLAFIGSTIVFIPVYFLLRPILNLLKKVKPVKKIALRIENYFESKAQSTLNEQTQKERKKPMSETLLKQLGVFVFVAIPLPMTGVWTGTAIAVFLNLKFKDVILPVSLGNLVAGLIISILAQICLTFGNIQMLDYILYGLLALAVILFVVVLIKVMRSKPKEEQKKQEAE